MRLYRVLIMWVSPSHNAIQSGRGSHSSLKWGQTLIPWVLPMETEVRHMCGRGGGACSASPITNSLPTTGVYESSWVGHSLQHSRGPCQPRYRVSTASPCQVGLNFISSSSSVYLCSTIYNRTVCWACLWSSLWTLDCICTVPSVVLSVIVRFLALLDMLLLFIFDRTVKADSFTARLMNIHLQVLEEGIKQVSTKFFLCICLAETSA